MGSTDVMVHAFAQLADLDAKLDNTPRFAAPSVRKLLKRQRAEVLDRLHNLDGAIRFYRASEEPYGCFSNLSRHPVEIAPVVYPTAEHAYQDCKPINQDVRDWLAAAPTPALLAMAAHALPPGLVVSNWHKIKSDVMRQVVRVKFTQHGDLRKILLGTGDRRIIECGTVDNPTNRYWGEVNGTGENMLGRILMETRAALRAAQ